MTYKTLIYFITLLFISSYYTIRKNYKNEYEIKSFLSGGIQASGNSSRTESVKYGIFFSLNHFFSNSLFTVHTIKFLDFEVHFTLLKTIETAIGNYLQAIIANQHITFL